MRISLLLTALAVTCSAGAAIIQWTNTSNGNWSVAANWSPNQVPSTNDLPVITNAGTYTVTLNLNPTIAGLILGGNSGTQTLATAGRTLTLNADGVVNPNGRVLLSGGAVSGSNQLHLAGTMTWQYGAIDTNTSLVVASGGSVTMASGANHAKLLYGNLTNEGVVTWQPVGNLSVGGTLHNRAGGWFDAQADSSITKSGSNAVIVNDGRFRKSTASGDLDCYVPWHNRGTVDPQIGALILREGSSFHDGSVITGAGELWLHEGTHTLAGWLVATNLLLTGGTLAGHGTLSGTCRWSSGQIAETASLTVATNGTLLIASGAKFAKYVYGNLTNAGTIIWQPLGSLSIGGTLHNLPGALFEAQVDNTSVLASGSGGLIINDGLFRKSAGSYAVGCEVPFRNNGTVEILPGTLRFHAAYLNPAGTIALMGGALTTAEPLSLPGGLLTGWGTVTADVTNGACIRPAPSNGVLTINGKCAQLLGGRMEFDLAGNIPGTNQSRLNITGGATLRGTVGVRWADSFLPSAGTNFSVLTFASRQGEFCCFDNFLLLGQGRRLTPVYGATSFTLATVVAPEPVTVPLRVTVDDSALICWPAEFPGYKLYWSTNLSQTNWTVVAGATNRWLETAPLAREKLFRLHKP